LGHEPEEAGQLTVVSAISAAAIGFRSSLTFLRMFDPIGKRKSRLARFLSAALPPLASFPVVRPPNRRAQQLNPVAEVHLSLNPGAMGFNPKSENTSCRWHDFW
jgi:hypothetical protein